MLRIIGMGPKITWFLKEVGRRDDNDGLVLRYALCSELWWSSRWYAYCLSAVWKKGMDGYFYLEQMARMKFRLFYLLLEIYKYLCVYPHVVFFLDTYPLRTSSSKHCRSTLLPLIIHSTDYTDFVRMQFDKLGDMCHCFICLTYRFCFSC